MRFKSIYEITYYRISKFAYTIAKSNTYVNILFAFSMPQMLYLSSVFCFMGMKFNKYDSIWIGSIFVIFNYFYFDLKRRDEIQDKYCKNLKINNKIIGFFIFIYYIMSFVTFIYSLSFAGKS